MIKLFLLSWFGIGLQASYCAAQSPSTGPAVAAGGVFTLSLRADGSLWSWGSNSHGTLGDSSLLAQRVRPNVIATPPRAAGTSWSFVDASDTNSAALRSDGSLWVWGQNTYGQIGNGVSGSAQYVPRRVPTPPLATPGTTWTQVELGQMTTLALRSDYSLWGWGRSDRGMLGNGTLGPDIVNPAQVITPSTAAVNTYWTSMAAGQVFAVALRSDGTLWAWGYTGDGSLGGGVSTVPIESAPVQVAAPVGTAPGAQWTQVAAGYAHALALRSDGSLWAWGSNNTGQLGIGTTAARSFVPVRVDTPAGAALGTTWLKVWAGNEHSLALRSDSTLWVWGRNTEGQLGDNTTITRLAPVQEFTHGRWISASAGQFHSLAMRAGRVHASGGMDFNTNAGQLGDGTRNGSAYFRPCLVPLLALEPAAGFLMAVYPNPAHGSVSVKNMPSRAQVKLYDLSGHLCRQYDNDAVSATKQLDVQDIAPGLYLLCIQSQRGEKRMMRLTIN